MAICRRCSTELPGRRQLCDSCKADRPGTADTVAARKSTRTSKPAKSKSTPKPAAVPEGLHRKGRALWAQLEVEDECTPLGVLALEVCRTADRLDELDRIIAGKGVMQLMQFRLGEEFFDRNGDAKVTVTVGFQSVLAEARGQQTQLREGLKSYQAMKAEAAAKGGAGPLPAAPPVATGLDQLSQRRAQREQASAGS